ncbi:hypothetical protein Pmani_000228 [Petrolisthes manimaculis]|uniref:Sulfotransferase domain-containing protein n=1 Tax=Petrolisthes manimaculis TaxID=1843537 RepID=A0AAE1QNA2_9EUCA|nr:hypothetical protein Pmani_000228 [Petrolisthes manimaculis]
MDKKRKLLTGHEVEAMSEEWQAKMGNDLEPFPGGYVKIIPGGWIYPGRAPFFIDKIQKFQVLTTRMQALFVVTALQGLTSALTSALIRNLPLQIVEQTSFSNMKYRGEPAKGEGLFNEEVKQKNGGFFRKGVVGDWKNHFSPQLNQEIDMWINKNVGDIPFNWG